MKFVTNLNLNENELQNGKFQVVASDPSTNNFEGRLVYNSTEKTLKYYDGTAWKRAVVSGSSAGSASTALTISNESNGALTFTPNLATTSAHGVMSSQDKTKLEDATADATASKLVIRDGSGNFKAATPTDSAHVATKGYVDSARQGLDVKASSRVATTVPVLLASGLENGDTVDGVVLATNDRVLVKDQSTASENGIYVVQASGAAVRADDFDSSGKVTTGAFTFIAEGTTNGDQGFVLTTNDTITLGTTGLTFTQFSGTGQIEAGDALSKSGNTINVNVGTGIEVHSDALRIKSDAAGDGLGYTAGVISVNVGANTGLEITSDSVGIKLDAGISGLETTSSGLKIKSDIAGDGIGYALGVLSVNVSASNGLEITSDNVGLKLDAGIAGLTTTSSGLKIKSDIAGTGITYTAGVLSRNVIDLGDASSDTTGTLPIDQGGTNAVSASAARTSLAATPSGGSNTSTPTLARVASKAIGDGTLVSYVVTHNFNTKAVVVQVYDTAGFDTVIADVERTTVDTVTVSFSVAPTNNQYTVVITG